MTVGLLGFALPAGAATHIQDSAHTHAAHFKTKKPPLIKCFKVEGRDHDGKRGKSVEYCSNDQRASDTRACGGPRTPSDIGCGHAEDDTRRTPHGSGPSPAGSGQPATASAAGEAWLSPAQ
jgi:hypothetical protein